MREEERSGRTVLKFLLVANGSRAFRPGAVGVCDLSDLALFPAPPLGALNPAHLDIPTIHPRLSIKFDGP